MSYCGPSLCEQSVYDLKIMNLDKVISWFGADLYNEHQQKIDSSLKASYDLICSYCARVFHKTLFKERYISNGTDEIILSQYPLRNILSLFIDEEVVSGADYDNSIYSDSIVSFDFTIRPKKKISIEYEAGFSIDEMPESLVNACLLQASYLFKQYGGTDPMIGYKSISKMEENITKDDTSNNNYGLISEVRGMVTAFKRIEVPSNMSFRSVV